MLKKKRDKNVELEKLINKYKIEDGLSTIDSILYISQEQNMEIEYLTEILTDSVLCDIIQEFESLKMIDRDSEIYKTLVRKLNLNIK